MNQQVIAISAKHGPRLRELPMVTVIGPRITHKKIIIDLYEQQVAPPDIAKRTHHSLEAVDRYIKDYEKVKFLVRRKINQGDISHLTGRGKKVIDQYLDILKRHHPSLFEDKFPDQSNEE